MITDEDLALEAQKGNEYALESLMKKYKGLVNKIARCYFLVGGDLEDIIQEEQSDYIKQLYIFRSKKTHLLKLLPQLASNIKFKVQ